MHQDKREEMASQGKPYLWRCHFKSLSCFQKDGNPDSSDLHKTTGTLIKEESKEDDDINNIKLEISQARDSLLTPQTNLAPLFSDGGLLILPNPFDLFEHKHDLALSIASSYIAFVILLTHFLKFTTYKL